MSERDETRGNLTAALLCVNQVWFFKELPFGPIVTRTAHGISLTYMKTSSCIQRDNSSKLGQVTRRALLDSQTQPDVLRGNPKLILQGRTTGQLPQVSAGLPCSPQPAPHEMLLPSLIISLQGLHLLSEKVSHSQTENGPPCYMNTPGEISRIHILKYSF